jgi:hypothetical protein
MHYHQDKIIADDRHAQLQQNAQRDSLIKISRRTEPRLPMYAPLLSHIGAWMVKLGHNLQDRYALATEAAQTVARDVRATSTSEFPRIESPA